MILTKQQISRYMRHIIMPEISGQGQKKLLEAAVFIYGENVEDMAPLVYYLAASGVGNIYCCFEAEDGYERLFHKIRDLNDDISIELSNGLINADNERLVFRIVLGSIGFVDKISCDFITVEKENMFIPTITAIKNKWKGTLQTFDKLSEFKIAADKLSYNLSSYKPDSDKSRTGELEGNIITGSILGALCAVEMIKHCLKLEETDRNMLYFNIFSMEFSKMEHDKIDTYLDKLARNNYDDNASYDGIEKNLSACKVLIVGTGGLGAPAAFALARAGIGTIGLVDYDKVEISNLNRQIFHSMSRIGMSKVESAKIFLQNINPHITINTYDSSFNKNNAIELISDYDIIIDGVDNFPARYLLNDACFFMKKPMIEAGAIRYSGLNTTIIPGEGHCYRCAFPNISKAGNIPSCAEAGVLGPVPGVMGFIQAAETIKLATGKGKILKNKLLFFDAQDLEFTMVDLSKDSSCLLCGEQANIDVLQEYDFVCKKIH